MLELQTFFLLTQQISDGLPFGLLQVTTSLSSECCLFLLLPQFRKPTKDAPPPTSARVPAIPAGLPCFHKGRWRFNFSLSTLRMFSVSCFAFSGCISTTLDSVLSDKLTISPVTFGTPFTLSPFGYSWTFSLYSERSELYACRGHCLKPWVQWHSL